MMVLEAVDRLLRYFAPEERSIPSSFTHPGRCEDCIDALNDALTEIVEESPAFLRQDSRGRTIHSAVSVTAGVAYGLFQVSIPSGDWASWMLGCSIVFAGGGTPNVIVASEVSGGSRILTLRYPWSGASGSVSAVIHCDAFVLQSDELGLIDRVSVVGSPPMIQIGGRHELSRGFRTDDEDYGRPRIRREVPDASVSGLPSVFWMENLTAGPTAIPSRLFRIYPFPRESGALSLDTRVAPVRFTVPDTTLIPMTDAHASLILLPVAAFLLRRSAYFRDSGNSQVMLDAYQAAKDRARELAPSPRNGPRFAPKF